MNKLSFEEWFDDIKNNLNEGINGNKKQIITQFTGVTKDNELVNFNHSGISVNDFKYVYCDIRFLTDDKTTIELRVNKQFSIWYNFTFLLSNDDVKPITVEEKLSYTHNSCKFNIKYNGKTNECSLEDGNVSNIFERMYKRLSLSNGNIGIMREYVGSYQYSSSDIIKQELFSNKYDKLDVSKIILESLYLYDPETFFGYTILDEDNKVLYSFPE